MKLQCHLQKATLHLDSLPHRKEFICWIKAALTIAEVSFDCLEITIRFVDEQESECFNKQYRHKSGPTNILSFTTEDPPNALSHYLGDLLVCVPLVLKEAKEQDKSNMAHFAHLTIHGVLHLLGHDHINKGEAATMEGLEIKALKQLGYENPYR